MSQHTAKSTEHLWIYSMSKRFRVLGIFDTDDAANKYCTRHDEAAVIACFGPFVIVANKYDGERHDVKIPEGMTIQEFVDRPPQGWPKK